MTVVVSGPRESMRAVIVIAIMISSTNTIAHGQTLQQQEICAKQAKAYFQEYNADDPKLSGFKSVSDDYQSHYNMKLNKCFVYVESMSSFDEEFYTSAQLVDAFERRIFATYGWISHMGKKYWEVPPSTCELTPRTGEKTNCSSKDEFDVFVAKYMEERE